MSRTGKTLKIYLRHTKKYWLSGTVLFLSTVGASAIGAVVPLYFKKFFDVFSSPGAREAMAQSLISVLVIIAMLELADWAFWRTATFFASYFQSKVIADLGNTCFQYLHKHSFGFFNNNFIGSLVKRVNRFTRSFESITDRLIFNIMQLLVSVIVILSVLFVKNIWLGLGLVIWMLIFLIINLLFIKYKMRYDIERSETDSKLTGILADTITNHLNVKLFNGYKRESQYYAKVNDRLRHLRSITWNFSNTFEAAQGFLVIILEIGLFYFAINLWERGLFTVGDFVLLQSYILIVIMRIWDFGRIVQRTYEDLAEADEMTEILSLPHEIKDALTAVPLDIKEGKIEFQNVRFNYNETRTVLKDFDLTIRGKEKIALVGPSGAGKTTIIKLLVRLHDLTDGKIFIDDQKIKNVTLESLWQAISLVPQDPILFHRTLLENIRYGRPSATDEEVIEASKLAHCHDFITKLESGYNTYVGERGVKLSGGERQRVAIARAILRNAPILLLDEATSSLDSESERLIQKALDNLMKDKTVIVIAHRLSTIMRMDRIVVVDNGKIVEAGTHDELLTRETGLYTRLWQLQAGGFIQ